MQGSLSVVPWSLVRGPKVPPLAAFHDIPPFCVFHDTCELFWENAHSSEWNVNSIFVCIHLSLPVSGCKQISLMQCNLKLSTYLVRPGKEIACVGCRRSVQQQTCLVSAGLVLEKHMRPMARWKKDESHYEGHCRRWRSLLQLPAALDWWTLQPFSPRCFSRFSSFLGMDPQFQSQLWVSTWRMSLV